MKTIHLHTSVSLFRCCGVPARRYASAVIATTDGWSTDYGQTQGLPVLHPSVHQKSEFHKKMVEQIELILAQNLETSLKRSLEHM